MLSTGGGLEPIFDQSNTGRQEAIKGSNCSKTLGKRCNMGRSIKTLPAVGNRYPQDSSIASCRAELHLIMFFFRTFRVGLRTMKKVQNRSYTGVLNGAIWGRQLCARRGLCFSLFLFVALVMVLEGRSCKKVFFFKL